MTTTLRDAVSAAARLGGDVSLSIAHNEDLLVEAAGMHGANLYGLVSVENRAGAHPRVCWSCSVSIDNVRLTVATHRRATVAEIQAVESWQESTELGRMGVLRHLVHSEKA